MKHTRTVFSFALLNANDTVAEPALVQQQVVVAIGEYTKQTNKR